MFKLISITAIAAGALLTALLGMETNRPASPSNPPAVSMQIPQQRMFELAGEFHVRLLVAAGEKLDSTVTRVFGGPAGGQCFANKQTEQKPSNTRAR